MAHVLDRLGVDVLEAGFPVASEGDFDAVQQIAREIQRPVIAALARATVNDVQRACDALKNARRSRLHIFLATSDIHLQYKLKTTRAEALKSARIAVEMAANLVDEVEFSAEDATRSQFEYLCEVVETAIDAGATTINIPDTVGYMLPEEYGNLIRRLKHEVRNMNKATLSVHCHNDLGLAVANTLAGVEGGATQVECTINGIGERAGNAALEEIIMAMHVRADRMPFETGIQTKLLCEASRELSRAIGFGPQPNKPIVGANAFAHEAGIHQHGVLANPLCYEIMTPESVGASGTLIVLGKHSGRHALQSRYAELGYSFTPAELAEIYHRFVELADRKKKIYDQDLIALVSADHRGHGQRAVGAVSRTQ